MSDTGLTFDEVQDALKGMSEEERQVWRDHAEPEDLQRIAKEEEQHMQTLASRPPLIQGEDEGVKVDGNPEGPSDPNPAADPDVIRELVGQKIKLERDLAAANAEIQAYYERFGPLGDA